MIILMHNNAMNATNAVNIVDVDVDSLTSNSILSYAHARL